MPCKQTTELLCFHCNIRHANATLNEALIGLLLMACMRKRHIVWTILLCLIIVANGCSHVLVSPQLLHCSAEQSVGGFVAGSQWLVWNFESDATLADAVEGPLGAFPDCIQEYILRNGSRMEQEERDIKVLMEWPSSSSPIYSFFFGAKMGFF